MTQKSKENSAMSIKNPLEILGCWECWGMVGNGGEWLGKIGNGWEWVGMVGNGGEWVR